MIYGHLSVVDGEERKIFDLTRLNSEAIHNVRSILIRSVDDKMFLGADNGVYEGDFPSDVTVLTEDCITFARDEMIDDSGVVTGITVNDVCELSLVDSNEKITNENNIILATDSGVFQSSYGMTLKDRDVVLSGKTFYDQTYFGGKIYFATDDGVYSLENGTIKKISDVVIKRFDHNDTICVAVSHDGISIYEVGGNTLSKIVDRMGITSCVVYSDKILFSVGRSVYSLTTDGDVQPFSDFESDINALYVASGRYLYVGTSDGLYCVEITGEYTNTLDNIVGIEDFKQDGSNVVY